MSQQVYEPKLFAHGTVPGSRTYVNSEHEQSTVVVIRPKSVLLTYVLWLFLGWLGIHKFYLRQPIQGLLYLALTGITSLLTPIGLGWITGIPLGLLLFKELFTKLNLKEIISKHLVTDNKRCYYHYLDADIVIQFL